MILGANGFRATRKLPTQLLSGPALTHGSLVFSDDERHFAVHDSINGLLHIWSMQSGRLVLTYEKDSVRKVAYVPAMSGFLAVAGLKAVLFSCSQNECNVHELPGRMPGIDGALRIAIDPVAQMIVGASVDRVVGVAVTTKRLVVNFDYRFVTKQLPECHLWNLSIRHDDSDAIVVRRILSYVSGKRLRYIYSTLHQNGTLLENAEIISKGFMVTSTSATSLGVFRAQAGGIVVVDDESSASFRIVDLPLFDAKMALIPSDCGRMIAGAAPRKLVIWDRDALLNQFRCNGDRYTLLLSNDGKYAAIIYLDKPGTQETRVTGLLDIAGGRCLGHCYGHWLEPYAFSPSNRFLATVITDRTAIEPDFTPGTIVLTKIRRS